MTKIGVIGVGKVGLPLACLLGRSNEVAVYDSSLDLLDRLRRKENPLPREPGIEFNFEVKSDVEECIRDAEFAFVVTPTPLVGTSLSAEPVTSVIEEISLVARSPIIVDVVSTLDPRTAAATCAPMPNVEIVYNPPLIRLGQVVRDLVDASILFLGTDSKDHTVIERILPVVRQSLRQTIVRGSVTDVAVAKLAINATLSMRAAWANEVGWKASNMGADPAIVFQALSAEPRIGGTSYMMPGPPPGGPCLPRDLVVWSDLDHEWNPGRVPNLPRWARASEARARTRDDNSTITDAVSRTHDIANEVLVDRAVTFAKEKVLHDGGTVGIIGLGYKLHAHDITESIGPRIATALHHERYKVLGYDPSVTALVRRHHPAIEMVDGAREFARRADAIIICLPYHEDMEFLREADLSQRPILQLHVLGS